MSDLAGVLLIIFFVSWCNGGDVVIAKMACDARGGRLVVTGEGCSSKERCVVAP